MKTDPHDFTKTQKKVPGTNIVQVAVESAIEQVRLIADDLGSADREQEM